MDDLWDIQDPAIAFGLTTATRFTNLKAGHELKICYGERSNSFLLVEYGFALKNNKYDFVRVKNITIETFYPEPISAEVRSAFEANLEELWLKDKLQADLKLTAVHRDVLKLIRAYVKAANPTADWVNVEKTVLQKYRDWIEAMLRGYPTKLEEDENLLQFVEQFPDQFYWMYQFVLIYRIGQKQILREQLLVAGLLLKALDMGPEGFKTETKWIRETSMSMNDYFKNDLNQ